MRIPFGKPFPAIDSVSLRAGTAAGLVNGYINELDDYHMTPGHTLFATHSGAKSIDGLYETLDGIVLGITNGAVVEVNSDGTFTEFTGDTVTADTYYYWAEDNQNVFLAHGGKLARIDLTNRIVTLLNENTPSAVTHVVRSKGFILCNGNDRIMVSSPFSLSQSFDSTGDITGIVTLTDKPGWIVMSGSGSAAPNNVGRIYLSKDNGVTWNKVYTAAANSRVECVCYMSGGVVLAGTGLTTGRILRSTDYGETWTDIGQQGSSTRVIFIAKVDTNTAIAGVGQGTSLGKVYRSTNNGVSWTVMGTPTACNRVDSAIVWSTTTVTIGTTNDSDVAHVWRSTDGGQNFTDIATLDSTAGVGDGVKVTSSIGLLDTYINGATGKIYRSTDTGASWAVIGTIPDLQTDALPFAFLLTSTGDLLFATAGNNTAVGGAQIWKSNDLGVTWNKIADLDTNQEAIVNARCLIETHTAGQVMAGGRTALATVIGAAAKWQMGQGKNAPQGDVFFSEDVAGHYEQVDSWERFNAQAVPDGCTGVFENRSLVYTAGPRSIEINYNSPDPEFPWQVSDPALPYGLGAPFSWVNYDDLNTVMYLSCTDKIWEVVKFQGRVQQSISQVYSAILNDRTLITSPETAKAFGVTMRGIPMYVLTFQTDNLTICYNLLKDHWFRWAYWDGAAYQAALINSYAYSKTLKKHFVGDRRDTGKIFELTGTADDSSNIRFELTSGHVGNWDVIPAGRMVFKAKRGAVTDSSEPTFLWQNRDNGNDTFSTGRTVSLGIQNDTEMLGSLNRCGSYQLRQHRIVYLGSNTDFIFAGADES